MENEKGSYTCGVILKHWNTEIPDGARHMVCNLPFNVEEVCREIDAKVEKLQLIASAKTNWQTIDRLSNETFRLKGQIKQLQDIIEDLRNAKKGPANATQVERMINGFFSGDKKKIEAWWSTPNPMLGGAVPLEFNKSQPGKLLKIIRNQIEGNLP